VIYDIQEEVLRGEEEEEEEEFRRMVLSAPLTT
jgi:hypothetical protein